MIYRGLAPQPQWRRTSSRAQHFIVCRASFFFFFLLLLAGMTWFYCGMSIQRTRSARILSQGLQNQGFKAN